MKPYYICGVINNEKFYRYTSSTAGTHDYDFVRTRHAVRHPF